MIIDDSIPTILKLIKQNDVVSITSPTGSGKSIALPKAIVNNIGVCMIAIPTRTAVISLANYQKNLSINDKKIIVGTAADEIISYNKNSTLIYATGGHIRKKIISNISDWSWCKVLMVDEAHTGTIDVNLIISLWQYAKNRNYIVPKLVIASATPTLFDIQSVSYTVMVPQNYPIKYTYITKEQRGNSSPNNMNNILKLCADFAIDYDKNNSDNNNHILIFVAGKKEITTLVSYLTNINAVILQAYGEMDSKKVNEIYENFYYGGKLLRKIIVTTNIAETAITIENIGLVIDTLIEKVSGMSYSGGHRLETTYVSKDSAIQRAGRTGRTGPGECIRMLPEEDYMKLNAHRIPEIYRVPIYELILELYSKNIDPIQLFKGWGLDDKIDNSIKILLKLELIKEDGNSFTVTDIGSVSYQLKLSVKNATFLCSSILSGNDVYSSVVIANIIDNYWPPYYFIPNDANNEHKNKYFSKYIGKNDLDTAINMWNDGIKYNFSEKWIKRNSLNGKQIRDLIKNINRTLSKITNMFDNISISQKKVVDLDKYTYLLTKIYSDSILVNRRANIYVSYKLVDNSRFEYHVDSSFNRYSERWPNAILSLISTEFVSRTSDTTTKTERRRVSFSINIDYDENSQIITNQFLEKIGAKELAQLTSLLTNTNVVVYSLDDIIDIQYNQLLSNPDLADYLKKYVDVLDITELRGW